MRTDFLDFPTAWDIQREVGHELPHDELCSSVYSIAFLCDCGAVPNEWERRRQLLDGASDQSDAPNPQATTTRGRRMTILYERPEWQQRAACRGMGPEMFFLERKPGNATGDEAAAARAICDTCTVAAECRQAGEVEVFGIWAGTSPRQRQRMRGNAQGVRIKRRVDAAVCGTVAGHDVHRRNGEPPCRHCEWAYNEWLRVRANDSQWRKGRKRGEAAA